MAVSAHVYGLFLTNVAEKVMNLNTDALKVALVQSTYTPAQATDQYWSTPQAYEATGTGYTAGGAALTGVSVTNTSNTFNLNASNVTWTTITTSARYAVIYDSSPGTAGTDPLIGYVDFGATQSPSGINFSINWNAGVVLQMTAS